MPRAVKNLFRGGVTGTVLGIAAPYIYDKNISLALDTGAVIAQLDLAQYAIRTIGKSFVTLFDKNFS